MARPVIRFPNVSEIEMVLMARPEIALGGGEASSAPIAAAIGNAIFDAVGVRLREAPFTPARVLAGLNKASRRKNLSGWVRMLLLFNFALDPFVFV